MAKDYATPLAQLGGELEKLTRQIDEVKAELRPLIIAAAAAGMEQHRIVDLTGYTRETIRKMCLSEDQREAEEQARRKRRKKSPPRE